MATVTVSANPKALNNATVTLSGYTASTLHGVTITNANGAKTVIKVTTDGSGNATFNHAPPSPGSHTFDVRPFVEHTAGTTPAATTTVTVSGG